MDPVGDGLKCFPNRDLVRSVLTAGVDIVVAVALFDDAANEPNCSAKLALLKDRNSFK